MSRRTRLFGVIGSPIGHSLSPAMHMVALRAMHVDAVYSPIEVPPKYLAPILRALILAGVEGLNVTVPLKETVIPLLDRIDPTARAIGAVNTIVIRARQTIGYNTDGVGFMHAINELGWRSSSTHAAILGAGGAARAVAWELTRLPGSRLTIANRHRQRAQLLVRWLRRVHPRALIRAVSLDKVTLDDVDLLVNATTVGMRPSDRSPVDLSTLRRDTIVYDLVYYQQTAFVKAAHRRGCVAANGASMLLYQGAESLRLWTHRPPPLNIMRRVLRQAIGRNHQ